MKKLLSLILLLLSLTGCNSELTYSEIKIEKANQDIQSFIESVQGENGTYLYFNGEKEQYIFLNGINADQGKTVYFSDFKVDTAKETINIRFTESETKVDATPERPLQALYKIKLDKKYETIRVFCNGEKIPFDTVFGG